jgi:transposase-like protein
MTKRRKVHTPEFKTKVALAAIKGMKTSSELASQYLVHPTQISSWKKQVIESMPDIFQRGKQHKQKNEEELTAPLYEEIGRLKMELDWLKKKCTQFSDE